MRVGVAQRDEVDPADAAGAAGGRAVLAAGLAQRDRRARRRARSGTGRSRRGWRRPWRCPRSRRCPSGRRRCRCTPRRETGFDEVTNGYVPWSMSSSVPWAPSKSTLAPRVEHVPGEPRRVGDVLRDPVAVGQVVLGHRLQVELRRLGVRAQREALGLHRGDDLLLEDLLVEQVLDADAQARGLVGVAGADAAPRGADLQLAELRLARVVEEHVVRHDQVRVGADPQAARGRRPWRAARPARRSAPSGRSRRRCRSRTACPGRGSPTGSGGTSSARRRARWCARRCCRPGSGSPCPPSRRGGRRPCPCPRRPTGRPRSRFRPCRGISLRRARAGCP